MPREASWRRNLTTMPKNGHFEVMRVREVFRHVPEKLFVIEPDTGRMYVPTAWRPIAKTKRKPKR